MSRLAWCALLLSIPVFSSSACSGSSADTSGATPAAQASTAPGNDAPSDPDPELTACMNKMAEIEGDPALPGAPDYEASRVTILGRARGEPMVFAEAPARRPAADAAFGAAADVFDHGRPGIRVDDALRRHKLNKPLLRYVLLRDGYAYSAHADDAVALVTRTKLTDLFDEPKIFLVRGHEIHALTLVKEGRESKYMHEGGSLAGMQGELLFGDRVSVNEADLAAPLHRDVAALAYEIGFDRSEFVKWTAKGAIAKLRVHGRWARAVIATDAKSPAALSLACFAEEKIARGEIEEARAAAAHVRRALSKIRETITTEVDEALRFDRPLNEKNHDRDGILRPAWMTAYLQGRPSFGFEGAGYPVFDLRGRPTPPQVCVDFVLDTYERAAGTWFAAKGEAPGRVRGRLNFDDANIPNRRGVMAFGDFAAKHAELFEVRHFVGAERIPFGERARFFKFLADHADEIHAGDVVAIHGMKRDNRIHQHAIFVERTDPVTGFAFGLADQMKKPRRRTWEGIMAEAPKRSLYYRIRPVDEVWKKIDPGA